MLRRPENSTIQISAEFRDENNTLTVPANVRYRIDDDASGVEIVGWTSVTADESVTITIPAASNAIYNRSNKIERRTVTVTTPDCTDEYEYELFRLDGLNS